MEITGRIFKVLPLVSGTSARGEWKKQDYILEYNLDQQYPRKMLFNLWGDNITNNANMMQEGQFVTVSFDIDCREFNGRWFNDIRAWRIVQATPAGPAVNNSNFAPIQPQGGGFVSEQQPLSTPAPAPTSAPVDSPADDSSDLPF